MTHCPVCPGFEPLLGNDWGQAAPSCRPNVRPRSTSGSPLAPARKVSWAAPTQAVTSPAAIGGEDLSTCRAPVRSKAGMDLCRQHHPIPVQSAAGATDLTFDPFRPPPGEPHGQGSVRSDFPRSAGPHPSQCIPAPRCAGAVAIKTGFHPARAHGTLDQSPSVLPDLRAHLGATSIVSVENSLVKPECSATCLEA